MKKRTACTLFLTVLLLSCTGFPPIKNGETKLEVQVEQLIREIKLTLAKVAESTAAESLPKLKSATVNLETQLSTSAGGGFRLLVVSTDAKVTETNTQKIRIKLVPEPVKGAPIKISSISENLAEAILSISRGVAKADDMEPRLDLTELTASMRFVVKQGAGGGVRFLIVPVTVDLGGDIKETHTHSIELSFKK